MSARTDVALLLSVSARVLRVSLNRCIDQHRRCEDVALFVLFSVPLWVFIAVFSQANQCRRYKDVALFLTVLRKVLRAAVHR